MAPENTLPKPYLTGAEVNERLKVLGFEIGPHVLDYPPGHQKERFTALQELIAGGIAEWAGVEASDDTRIDQVNQEILEWTEDYLVTT